MTQARPQPASDSLVTPEGPPSPEQQTGSSKSRQKKFHRHFKQVAAEELVLNCEYCRITHVGRQSIKKPNFWNSEPASTRSTFALVALCSGDFKLHSDASSITPCQLVTELDALEWVCVLYPRRCFILQVEKRRILRSNAFASNSLSNCGGKKKSLRRLFRCFNRLMERIVWEVRFIFLCFDLMMTRVLSRNLLA